jgi:hypothetical protein
MNTVDTEKLYGAYAPQVVDACGLRNIHIQYVNKKEIERRQALRHFMSLVKMDLDDFEECSEDDRTLSIPTELAEPEDLPASHYIANLVEFDIDEGVKPMEEMNTLSDTHFLAYIRDTVGNILYLGVSSVSPELAIKSLMRAVVGSSSVYAYMQAHNTSCLQDAIAGVLRIRGA